MNEGSLRDDLLSIPGVEGADIEGSPDKPAGLRIRIAEGADQHAVGGAIRRVLTSHGLGTDTKLPGESDVASGPEAEPPAEAGAEAEEMRAPAAVAVADEAYGEPSGADTGTASVDLTDAEAGEGPGTPIVDLTDQGDVVGATEPESSPEPLAPPAEGSRSADEESTTRPPNGSRREFQDTSVPRLESVAVEEGRDGIVVSVSTTSGDRVRQAAASTEGGVESAVVRATARLARPHAPEASVVDIEDRRVEGVDIVMIVLDVDGTMHAGSAVVAAGRSFALGRATWAALTI